MRRFLAFYHIINSIELFKYLSTAYLITASDRLTPVDFFYAQFVDINQPAHISLSDQHFRHKRRRRGSTVTLPSDKWPNGRIPYILSPAYSFWQRAVIARAITSYNARTCIRFTPKQPYDKDYVIISKIDGCFADFARTGGPQYVSLTDECITYATIIHELMHVIGFIHEHQREDRDSFVDIIWSNIIQGADADFEKLSAIGLSYYGEAYDYFSIMHYESTEGSKNGRNTILARIAAYTDLMGKSNDFSQSDINRINRAYTCYSYLTSW